MPWLIARFQPTSLFSLKHGDATSTGGKSLLVPTPFAIRMALLDAAIRTEGIGIGPEAFARIKALRLAIRPPDHAAVTSIFVKVLKPEREAEARGREMTPTIAFREYVHLAGELVLALGGASDTLELVSAWLPHVSYFGKRGSFFQLLEPACLVSTLEDETPEGFVVLQGSDLRREPPPQAFPLGIIQRLDDWGESMTFDKVNIYNRDRQAQIRLHQERVRMDVIFPYRLARSSRGFTLYERI